MLALRGNHIAVTVMDGTRVSQVSNRVGEGSSKQHVKLSRGLSIKQPLGVRSSVRVPIAAWIMGVSDMIDDEARRMQHVLDRDYEVIDDDDDPNWGDFEAEMTGQSMLIRDEVVEVVDDEVVSQ
ncbi:hypothetical protein V6N13_059280 [Hibiscus sabdariffa]|uniref:Uncharacterized protein n=1 Tax=Hibiscus sabdariffa TaxID=183260 RepID=A0ABR2GFA4_9ROSI